MYILFGIGNLGKEYIGTRHNVGVAFLEWSKMEYAKSDGFVNTSGAFVKKLLAKKKTPPKRLFVAHDDLDIEFGKFKISFGRNSAGHKGVQSVIDHLKTNKFWRIRIGIANKKLASARKNEAVPDFVLAKFTPAEHKNLETVFTETLHALEHHLNHA